MKKLIITLVFEENANFFAVKLSKIAENCDHNIDPRLDDFSANSAIFFFGKHYENNNK
jgi:hypothetical protein